MRDLVWPVAGRKKCVHACVRVAMQDASSFYLTTFSITVTGKDPLLKKLHSMAFGKQGKAAEVKVCGRRGDCCSCALGGGIVLCMYFWMGMQESSCVT